MGYVRGVYGVTHLVNLLIMAYLAGIMSAAAVAILMQWIVARSKRPGGWVGGAGES